MLYSLTMHKLNTARHVPCSWPLGSGSLGVFSCPSSGTVLFCLVENNESGAEIKTNSWGGEPPPEDPLSFGSLANCHGGCCSKTDPVRGSVGCPLKIIALKKSEKHAEGLGSRGMLAAIWQQKCGSKEKIWDINKQ